MGMPDDMQRAGRGDGGHGSDGVREDGVREPDKYHTDKQMLENSVTRDRAQSCMAEIYSHKQEMLAMSPYLPMNMCSLVTIDESKPPWLASSWAKTS